MTLTRETKTYLKCVKRQIVESALCTLFNRFGTYNVKIADALNTFEPIAHSIANDCDPCRRIVEAYGLIEKARVAFLSDLSKAVC